MNGRANKCCWFSLLQHAHVCLLVALLRQVSLPHKQKHTKVLNNFWCASFQMMTPQKSDETIFPY